MEDKIKETLKLFMNDFLYNYVFEYNTEEVLKEIKQGLDKICENFLNGGLIISYKNTCDESNNHKYIVDLRMVVADTYVKIVEDGETYVLQTTLFKKGMVNVDSGFTKGEYRTNETI